MSPKLDWRNPSRGLMIALIALLSIGLGFLADLAITLFEKNAYPLEYAEYVSVYAEEYGIPESVVYAVIRTESEFDSGAVSSAGAVGLMQLMPETFRQLTDEVLFEHLADGMLYDPETNIRYGIYYLSYLYDRYGDWETALAAYNGGLGNVDEWLESDRYADGEGGLKHIPFRETRQFVSRVDKARHTYERLYGKIFAREDGTAPAK